MGWASEPGVNVVFAEREVACSPGRPLGKPLHAFSKTQVGVLPGISNVAEGILVGDIMESYLSGQLHTPKAKSAHHGAARGCAPWMQDKPGVAIDHA